MSDISGLYSDNRIRITGLASGMDTEGTIKKMMAAENLKVEKMKQARQMVQWKQEAYRDVIKELRDMRSNYFLWESPEDTNLIKAQAYTGSSITSTDNSVVTATALPGAANGVSSIVVKEIAKAAKVEGTKLIKSGGGDVTTSTTLSQLGITNPKDNQGKITIDLGNSQTATINVNGDMKLQDLISSIYSTKVDNTDQTLYSKIKVSFSELTGKLSIETRDTGASKTLKISGSEPNVLQSLGVTAENKPPITSNLDSKLESGKKLSEVYKGFTADGKITLKTSTGDVDIIVKPGETIDDVITNINSKGDFKATFNSTTKEFQLKNTNVPPIGASLIEVVSDTSPFKLIGSSVATGQDAKVSIKPPGSDIAIDVTKPSNSFTIDNITYNVLKVSPKDPLNSSAVVPTTLTTAPDAQKSFDKIKGFVEKYNTLIKKLTDKVGEKKDLNYKPLTDAQKKDMKEDQIKVWEDKAKLGILKNEGDIENIVSGLRRAFSEVVSPAGLTLKDIGIETYGHYEAVSKAGQLKIDESKLKDALQNRGDQVMKLFTNFVSDSDVKTEVDEKFKKLYPDGDTMDIKKKSSIMAQLTKEVKFPQTGIFKRMEDLLYTSSVRSDGNLMSKASYVGASNEATSILSKQLITQDKAIKELTKKVASKQERYYQMFAKLETAMNRLNSQQNWLAQQMGR